MKLKVIINGEDSGTIETSVKTALKYWALRALKRAIKVELKPI